MVNSNVKTTNKKRKSPMNTGVECPQPPSKKQRRNNTPVKDKASERKTSKKCAKQKPKKVKKKAIKSGKKMNRFSGTSKLKDFNQKKVKLEDIKKKKSKSKNEASLGHLTNGVKKKPATQAAQNNKSFKGLMKKIKSGDKTALIEIQEKINDIKRVQKNRTTLAKRKLRQLNNLKQILLAQKPSSPTASLKKDQHLREGKVKQADTNEKKTKTVKEVKKDELSKPKSKGSMYTRLSKKVLHIDPSRRIQFLDKKIKNIESRPERSKTATRKLRALSKLKKEISEKEPASLIASVKEEQYQQQPEGESLKLASKRIKEEVEDEFYDYEVDTKIQPDEITISEVKLEEFSDQEDDFFDGEVKAEVQSDEITISEVKLEKFSDREEKFSNNYEFKAEVQPDEITIIEVKDSDEEVED